MKPIHSTQARLARLKIEINEKPQLFAHLADCYILTGKFKKAAITLSKGLEAYPKNASGWLIKAKLNMELNQPKLALAAYKQAIKLDDKIAYAHERCAVITFEETDLKENMYHLGKLKKIEPLDDGVQAGYEYAILRIAAVEHGLFTEAGAAQVRSTVLRQKLKEHNLVPQDISRRDNREEESHTDEKTHATGQTETQEADEKNETDFQLESIEGDEDFEESSWAEEPEMAAESPISGESAMEEPPDESEIEGLEEEETDSVEEEFPESEISSEPPLMKLLRGEMVEQPASREVTFEHEGETSEQDISDNMAAEFTDEESEVSPLGAESKSKVEENIIREKSKLKLAEIAREITSSTKFKPVSKPESDFTDAPVSEEPPPASHEDDQVMEIPSPSNDAEDVHSMRPANSRDDSKERIATKTLAELYASQGNFKSAIEVYEELLNKHPGNEAYLMRIDNLRKQLESD